MKKDLKKIKNESNVPFKFNCLLFNVEASVKPFSNSKIVFLIIICMVIFFVGIFMLKQYAIVGFSMPTISKLWKIGISKIIKSRSP